MLNGFRVPEGGKTHLFLDNGNAYPLSFLIAM